MFSPLTISNILLITCFPDSRFLSIQYLVCNLCYGFCIGLFTYDCITFLQWIWLTNAQHSQQGNAIVIPLYICNRGLTKKSTTWFFTFQGYDVLQIIVKLNYGLFTLYCGTPCWGNYISENVWFYNTKYPHHIEWPSVNHVRKTKIYNSYIAHLFLQQIFCLVNIARRKQWLLSLRLQSYNRNWKTISVFQTSLFDHYMLNLILRKGTKIIFS